MYLEKPWDPDENSQIETLLSEHHKQQGGLLFFNPNVARNVNGSRQRRPHDILITDPPTENEGEAYEDAPANRMNLEIAISKYPTELIEVLGWGMGSFGRVVGKSRIVEQEWDPRDLTRTLIVNNDATQHNYNKDDSDRATEAVFDDFDIKIVIPD